MCRVLFGGMGAQCVLTPAVALLTHSTMQKHTHTHTHTHSTAAQTHMHGTHIQAKGMGGAITKAKQIVGALGSKGRLSSIISTGKS